MGFETAMVGRSSWKFEAYAFYVICLYLVFFPKWISVTLKVKYGEYVDEGKADETHA